MWLGGVGGIELGEEEFPRVFVQCCGRKRPILVVGGCREILGGQREVFCGYPGGGLLKCQGSPILLT